MKINFYLKNPTLCKTQKKNSLLLYSLSIYGKRIKRSTKVSLPVDKWDTQKQQVKKSHRKAIEINAYLNELRIKTENIYFDLLRQQEISFEVFKKEVEEQVFPKRDSKALGLIDVYKIYLNARELEVAKGTFRRLKIMYHHLQKFEAKKNQALTFDTVNIHFFERLKAYLMQEVKLTNNSLAGYIKSFKAFMNWCVEREYTDNIQFRKFKVKTEKTEIVYLTETEFNTLYKLDLSQNKTLDKVKDVFCFGCLTGQRFSDIEKIRREDIKGNTWHLRTQKTKDLIPVPLTSKALKIIEKYKYDEKPLPVMTNQRTNLYLKEVCKLAGIDDPITIVRYRGAERIEDRRPKYNFVATHTARKTFATLCSEKGMTNAEVMAITGHKDLKTFQKYSGSNRQVIEAKMQNIWDDSSQ